MTRVSTSLRASLALAALLIAAVGPAAAQGAPPAAPRGAPPAGSPGYHRGADQLAAALAAAAKLDPNVAAATVDLTDRYSIKEARRGGPGEPAVHPGWIELHYILEGSAVLVTGGKILPGQNGRIGTVEGGVVQRVAKGDAVVIPADTPHWYRSVDDHVTYLEVRFPEVSRAGSAKP